LINEVRSLYRRNLIYLNDEDKYIVESDLGKKVILENGNVIYLEVPVEDQEFLSEAEYQGRKVQLGKIMQGDIKKFKVYVKNDKGRVVKVNFGFGGKSAHGKRMVIKKNNPARRKSFRARHNCDNPGPRWKARYWACRTW
jgi:D-Tyr-tRNAtyr deacylase